MSIARVTNVIAGSETSFEDAIHKGVARATKTLDNVKGAWVENQKVVIEDGKVVEFRVNMRVTFVLNED